MIEQVLHFIHNYFEKAKYDGHYVISNGTITLPFVKYGQYFRIVGSDLNDGVYRYPAQLVDEEFDGEVWPLSVPKSLLSIIDDIEEWQSANDDVLNSPFQSESFGGYSYTKASGSGSAGKTATQCGWQDMFASRLNQWRKIG